MNIQLEYCMWWCVAASFPGNDCVYTHTRNTHVHHASRQMYMYILIIQYNNYYGKTQHEFEHVKGFD